MKRTLVPLLIALLPLCESCPTYSHYDRVEDERAIAAANLRKREYKHDVKSRKIAIDNVYVFDGFQYHSEPTTIVIDGSVIGNDSCGAIHIDGRGGTLMPGLFENHAHPEDINDLKNLTANGVTTTMCAACQTADLCESLRNQPGLTSFYSSGWTAVVPNSSHAQLARASPQQLITNVSMCPGWVQDRASSGSDYIKLIAETAGPTMSQEEHNTLVEAAHGIGLKTWTHASTLQAYDAAIRSKSDFIQHTPTDGPLNSSFIDMILANGQFSTPTATIYEFAEETLKVNAIIANRIRKMTLANIKAMYDAGIPLLAGTDASNTAYSGGVILFGSSLHLELELMVRAGVPNLEVLKAATSRPAEAYKLLDRGAISPGLRADLLLVNGNPLANISKTREIERVWIAGMEYQSQHEN